VEIFVELPQVFAPPSLEALACFVLAPELEASPIVETRLFHAPALYVFPSPLPS
jgi:hypothetical protein